MSLVSVYSGCKYLRSIICRSIFDITCSVNTIAYGGQGGGGGFLALAITSRLLAATLKLFDVWLPNFVTSCLYLLAKISQNLSRISSRGGGGGVAAFISQTRGHKNLET